jgi:hypothetical protein
MCIAVDLQQERPIRQTQGIVMTTRTGPDGESMENESQKLSRNGEEGVGNVVPCYWSAKVRRLKIYEPLGPCAPCLAGQRTIQCRNQALGPMLWERLLCTKHSIPPTLKLKPAIV